MKDNLIQSVQESLLERVRHIASRGQVDLEQLAKSLGVAEVAPRPIDFDGYLAKRADGKLAIRYRSDAPLTRIRFTVAHEIAHILIANELEREIESPLMRSNFRDDAEERLANRIAAELLMPAPSVTGMLKDQDVCWSVLFRIKDSFEVSLDTVHFRLRELEDLCYYELRTKLCAKGDAIGFPLVTCVRFGSIFFDDSPCSIREKLVFEMSAKEKSFTQHSLLASIDGKPICFRLLGWCRLSTERRSATFFGWDFLPRQKKSQWPARCHR